MTHIVRINLDGETYGNLPVAKLNSGSSASNQTFWRGDGSWARSWNIVPKTADQSRASTIAISDDSALVLAVSASKVYRIRLVWGMVCGATGGFRWRITGPSTPTRVTYETIYTSPTTTPTRIFNSAFDAADNTYSGDVGPVIFVVEMLLDNGANAGNVTLSWAQQTSNGTNTTVLAASSIEYMQFT
jgi:hypothetical protein